jgi:hypothetical protein
MNLPYSQLELDVTTIYDNNMNANDFIKITVCADDAEVHMIRGCEDENGVVDTHQFHVTLGFKEALELRNFLNFAFPSNVTLLS